MPADRIPPIGPKGPHTPPPGRSSGSRLFAKMTQLVLDAFTALGNLMTPRPPIEPQRARLSKPEDQLPTTRRFLLTSSAEDSYKTLVDFSKDLVRAGKLKSERTLIYNLPVLLDEISRLRDPSFRESLLADLFRECPQETTTALAVLQKTLYTSSAKEHYQALLRDMNPHDFTTFIGLRVTLTHLEPLNLSLIPKELAAHVIHLISTKPAYIQALYQNQIEKIEHASRIAAFEESSKAPSIEPILTRFLSHPGSLDEITALASSTDIATRENLLHLIFSYVNSSDLSHKAQGAKLIQAFASLKGTGMRSALIAAFFASPRALSNPVVAGRELLHMLYPSLVLPSDAKLSGNQTLELLNTLSQLPHEFDSMIKAEIGSLKTQMRAYPDVFNALFDEIKKDPTKVVNYRFISRSLEDFSILFNKRLFISLLSTDPLSVSSYLIDDIKHHSSPFTLEMLPQLKDEDPELAITLIRGYFPPKNAEELKLILDATQLLPLDRFFKSLKPLAQRGLTVLQNPLLPEHFRGERATYHKFADTLKKLDILLNPKEDPIETISRKVALGSKVYKRADELIADFERYGNVFYKEVLREYMKSTHIRDALIVLRDDQLLELAKHGSLGLMLYQDGLIKGPLLTQATAYMLNGRFHLNRDIASLMNTRELIALKNHIQERYPTEKVSIQWVNGKIIEKESLR